MKECNKEPSLSRRGRESTWWRFRLPAQRLYRFRETSFSRQDGKRRVVINDKRDLSPPRRQKEYRRLTFAASSYAKPSNNAPSLTTNVSNLRRFVKVDRRLTSAAPSSTANASYLRRFVAKWTDAEKRLHVDQIVNLVYC